MKRKKPSNQFYWFLLITIIMGVLVLYRKVDGNLNYIGLGFYSFIAGVILWNFYKNG